LNASAPIAVDFPTWAYLAFGVFVLAMLAIDLGVLNRKAHVVRFREALTWSAICVGLAAVFNVWLYFKFGSGLAQEFLAGYLLEEALSVDNIFVFVMIFAYFKVKKEYQHRLLFWGIIGALVLRGIMIWAGSALIARFDWVLYIFGAILIYTGIKMAITDTTDQNPTKSFVYRAARKFLPITDKDHGQRFLVKEEGSWKVTMLFLVLLIIETTDLLFALDSIPAVFAVTRSPFIIYTSNVFAILGLRALYFVLAGVMDMFRYLKYGLALVLVFVGFKMLVGQAFFHIPVGISLGVIASILLISVIASVLASRRDHRLHPVPPETE
jgi:tellurite resistance protein TerC